jgi:hypothetical protein
MAFDLNTWQDGGGILGREMTQEKLFLFCSVFPLDGPGICPGSEYVK